MRWKRVVIRAVLGGLLGFAGQFVTDFFYWNTPDDGVPPYQVLHAPKFEHVLAKYYSGAPRLRNQAHFLVYQGFILYWLLRRANLASRAALIVAFLGASAALPVDRKVRAPVVKTSAKQSMVAAILMSEPKDKENEQEPAAEPAQIEMAEQAAVLKADPKKEHAEA